MNTEQQNQIAEINKQTASTYIGFRNKQGFCPFYGQTYETFKVVGNIHDNPELMEGGAQ